MQKAENSRAMHNKMHLPRWMLFHNTKHIGRMATKYTWMCKCMGKELCESRARGRDQSRDHTPLALKFTQLFARNVTPAYVSAVGRLQHFNEIASLRVNREGEIT